MDNIEKKQRIWELDAFRGVLIIFMVTVHIVYDLTTLFDTGIKPPALYFLLKDYGAWFFILLSGACVTLGRRSFRRGLFVFGFGMVITLAMLLMPFVDKSFENEQIWFGILHLLGVSMMLYGLFKRMSNVFLAITAVLIIVCGGFIHLLNFSFPLSFVFGLRPDGFTSADYFPLFPCFGIFLLGAVIGKTVYKDKKSRINLPNENPPIRFLSLCGRHSLWIYLLHQPVIYGVLWLFLN